MSSLLKPSTPDGPYQGGAGGTPRGRTISLLLHHLMVNQLERIGRQAQFASASTPASSPRLLISAAPDRHVSELICH